MATTDKIAQDAANAVEQENLVSPATPAAPVTGERKGKQLSATVTPEFFAAFTDLKWDLRKDVPAMLREAAEDYLAKHKATK